MKPRSAKSKGTRLEKWIASELEKIGISARRQPGSGIYRDFPHDVYAEIGGKRFIIEAKARKEAPRVFEGWLGAADMLFIRADRSTPRVYMTFETLCWLVERANEKSTQMDAAGPVKTGGAA